MEKAINAAPPDVGALLPASYVCDDGDAGLALAASRCAHCGKPVFPAATICPFCLSTDNHPLPLRGSATLYSFTTVHTGPSTWETPYSIGYADFPNGVRVFAKLANSTGGWRIDAPVRLAVREVAPAKPGDAVSYRYFFEEAGA